MVSSAKEVQPKTKKPQQPQKQQKQQCPFNAFISKLKLQNCHPVCTSMLVTAFEDVFKVYGRTVIFQCDRKSSNFDNLLLQSIPTLAPWSIGLHPEEQTTGSGFSSAALGFSIGNDPPNFSHAHVPSSMPDFIPAGNVAVDRDIILLFHEYHYWVIVKRKHWCAPSQRSEAT